MDEQAKITLYKQLSKFEKLAKIKNDKLLEWERFLKLEDKEALQYTLEYRDKALEVFSKKKIIENEDKKEFYLELPDINLQGEDLSDIYLHTFRAGYSKERNNGKKIFVTTKINLKDTGCVINLATIQPIVISQDGVTIQEISADIKKCDFRGCRVFGKFQNTQAKLIYENENLPEEYIERLKKFEVPYDAELTTDYMYIDMLERKIVKGMNGLNKVKQIVDYDLTSMKKDIWKYRDVIKEHNIDISYTGAFLYEYGFKSIGKENYYINLEIRAKEAYQRGDLKYVENVFNELDKETRKNLVTLAFRDDKMEFVKRHQKELSALQKRYLEIQNHGMRIHEKEFKIKEFLRQEYKEGKMVELGIDIMNTNPEIRNDLVEEIYRLGDLKFVEKYLEKIDVRIKNDILVQEYKNGNESFVYRNFKKLDNEELKNKILGKEWENKNVEFLCENYEVVDSEDLKERIQKLAFKEEKVDFLRKYFEDFTKNMQMEAVIKFKNLGLPEERVAELLKK